MGNEPTMQPIWVNRGKTIQQLIKELQTFEDQGLFVEISIDGGSTHKPISLIKKSGQLCLLVNSEMSVGSVHET
jgi:pentose-5-phosphate-3-epimerase